MTLVYYSCQKDDVDVELVPDAGTGFLDVENDGYNVELNAQEPSEGQDGTWRIYSGENGRFEDEKDPNTKFYGEPGETYLLGWELSAGDQYKASTISVSFKPLNPVLISQPQDVVEDNVSMYLEAEPAKFGAEGKWEIIDGEDAQILNADSCVATFIGKENKEYNVKWSITYGSKSEGLELEINTDTLKANAGVDNLDITTFTDVEDDKFYNLNAFLPAGAEGEWNMVDGEGGMIYQKNEPTSILKGRADSTYTLTWKVRVGEYESIDTVRVRFRGLYGVWVDKRDKQEYKFVRIGKLEWMSENFNYAAPITQYGRNWYYGQSSRANVMDGHPVETPEDRKFYGRQYNYYGALDAMPVEGGWRLPSRKEIEDLVPFLGGGFYYWDKIMIGGSTGLDLNFSGHLLYGNESLDARDNFYQQDITGFYMTSNYLPHTGQVIVSVYDSRYKLSAVVLLPGYYTGNSVRYVRDVVEE
jgi:uncharacterized protein (TIGR02145 family)